jgi:hypothetical protein
LDKVELCFTQEISQAKTSKADARNTILTNLGNSQRKGYFWIFKYY